LQSDHDDHSKQEKALIPDPSSKNDGKARILQDLVVLEQMVSEMRTSVGKLKTVLGIGTLSADPSQRQHEVSIVIRN
jgi:hypothetical protein